MRTLNRNTQLLWCVGVSFSNEMVDGEGYYTGEYAKIYASPTRVRLNIYPANNSVVEEIFGKNCSFDMIAVSNDIELDKDSLLFINEPVEEFSVNYDYKIVSIAKSLNTVQYGLERRV